MEGKNHIWEVSLAGKAKKQEEKLPEEMRARLETLLFELRTDGPERKNWPHYGKIQGKGKDVDMRHSLE
jgi:mRNA-degrading endonuclease RelE of RelBE toxin-antitoxin system